MRAGRSVQLGEKARAYLVDPTHSRGAPLFHIDQTAPTAQADEHDGWTEVVTIQAYEHIKAEARKLKLRPKVLVDRGLPTGVSVWVGPNKEAIGWLKEFGYRYDPKSHRWKHPDKDPAYVAEGFEARPNYRVVREWDPDAPVKYPGGERPNI